MGTDRADVRKAELEVRIKPLDAEGISSAVEVGYHVCKIELHEVRKHEAIVQAGSPRDQLLPVGLAPELGDERPYQQLLGEAHAGMRGHLEGAQLEQAHARSRAFRRVKFVDTEFRAMGASSYIRKQVTEETVGGAHGYWLASLGDLVE